MKKLVLLWVVVFLLFSSNTRAQMEFKPIDLSINTPQEVNVYKKHTDGKTFLGLTFGTSIPFGDYGSCVSALAAGNINPGMGAGIFARYFISDHFAFGASFAFYKSGLNSTLTANLDTLFRVTAINDTLQLLSTSGSSTLYPFTINFEYFFSPLKRFKPYVGLGLGFYVTEYSVDAVTNKDKPADFRNVEALYGSNTDESFGLCPYVGFMYDFNELLSMNFDVKYNQIFCSPAASTLSVNVGIIFNLSYKY